MHGLRRDRPRRSLIAQKSIACGENSAYDRVTMRLPTLRFRAALGLLLLFLTVGHAGRARAIQPDLDRFPLQVHVFSRSVKHSKRFGSYKGEGKANLIEANLINGMEFSYDCLYKFHSSEEDEYYPARWKHEGLSLDILMGVIGSDTRTHTCELKIAMRETVFRKVNGKLMTMSPQEYASLDEARVERERSLTPVDLDPLHYPISFALLHLTWTGTVSGLHTGTGQGNIRSEAGMNAVDFSIHCPVVIQPTPEGRYLLGRWLEPGTHMLLLLRSIDVDGAPGATCDVTTVVEPDVYVRAGGNVKAVSQEEYRRKDAGAGGPATQ
jgi:hypothetical protein